MRRCATCCRTSKPPTTPSTAPRFGGESFFRQADREESLIHLLRVNVLKRMESAVSSFALTVQRQLRDVEAVLAQIEQHADHAANGDGIEELDIADVDIDDPAFEALLVGRKVKVLLGDVDLIRWRQDLVEDRNRLDTLLTAAQQVDAARDAKLAKLREMVEDKCRNPINDGNRKIIVFTAFSDTAQPLRQSGALAKPAGHRGRLVTGSAGIQTTLPGLRKSMSSVLSAFAPRAKERPADLADEGD
jgi:hypothetical protein